MNSRVEYWAAGVDCCQARSVFKCDDAMSPTARTGIVMHERAGFFGDLVMSDFDQYRKAVAQASAAFDLVPAKEVMFVQWVENADDHASAHYRHAVLGYVFTLLFYFGFSVVAGAFCHSVWKRSIE